MVKQYNAKMHEDLRICKNALMNMKFVNNHYFILK